MIADMLSILKNGKDLSRDEIANVMDDILSGKVSDQNICEFQKICVKKEKAIVSCLECWIKCKNFLYRYGQSVKVQ